MRPLPADEPIRIAHVVYALGVGGLETGLLNLIRGLDTNRFRHHVYCMKVLGENAGRARAAGAEVTLVGEETGRNRLIIPRLVGHFRRFRPHIVHSRNFGTVDAILAGALARAPWRVHGEHGWDVPDIDGTDRRRRRIRGLLSRFVHRYICVSRQLEEWLLEHDGRFAGKTLTIHNGVDLARYLGIQHSNAPSRPLQIGTIGRLAAVKDQVTLVRAFDRMAGRHSHARLSIVGEGPMRPILESAIASSEHGDRITLAGATSNVEQHYASFDVFVLPSLNEGISNTVLEAMASGLPVLASNVGGNPELVVDGVTGHLFAPGDVDRLAELLEGYANAPLRALAHGAAARRRAIEHFDLDRMIADYARFYEGLVRGPASPN